MQRHIYNYLLLGLFITILSSCEDKKDKTIVSFYETGEKFEKYQYIADSLKHGVYRMYSQKGLLLESANYVKGKLEGERVIFNKNGTKEISEIYKDDKLNGRYITFHPNGEMNMMGVYSDNVLSGTVSFFDSTGEIKEYVQFLNNFEVIPFQEYHENGKLKWEGMKRVDRYYGTKKDYGILKEYNENGEMIRKISCDEKEICTTIWSLEDSSK